MRFEDEQLRAISIRIDQIVAAKLKEFIDNELEARVKAEVKTQLDNRLRFLSNITGDK